MFEKEKLDYEKLPIDSGADSFINLQWDFTNNPITGFDFGRFCSPEFYESAAIVNEVMSKVFSCLVERFKDDWLISDPHISISDGFSQANLKMCMGKKSFRKKITEKMGNDADLQE